MSIPIQKRRAAIKSIRFSIKKPDSQRRSFAIVLSHKFLDGTHATEHLKDERLDSINNNLRRELVTIAGAYAEIKGSLIPTLKKEFSVKEQLRLEQQISDNNKKVYVAFWAEKYAGLELMNEASTRNDLLGALRAIEPESITAATKDVLRKKLGALSVQQQRRYSIRINQLLEFLGRGFKIEKRKRDYAEVDYVTWDELQKILPHIYSKEVRALAVTLWATGVRLGEAFAPSFCNLKANGTIFIHKQLDLNGQIRDIKNRKPHHTIILDEGIPAYEEWCAVENKERFRNAAINQIISASRKAFPTRKNKQVSAHDLRHSYAIRWLELGASLTQIATCLGDSIATVQLHYTGHVMTDETISNMRNLLPKKLA